MTNDENLIIGHIKNDLKIIHEIKKFDAPPYDSSDIYNKRYPWCDFGEQGYSGWKWKYDEDIIRRMDTLGISLAYKLITQYYHKEG